MDGLVLRKATTVPTAMSVARSSGKRYAPVLIAGKAIDRTPFSTASCSDRW
jgi:hypothetical protein